jgi:uncharacterized protein (DUF736 family)
MAQTREKPTFVVRAPDPHKRGRWLTVGAAWTKTLDDGAIGYSVKLNTIPVGAGFVANLQRARWPCYSHVVSAVNCPTGPAGFAV